jgi:hypothetical protein
MKARPTRPSGTERGGRGLRLPPLVPGGAGGQDAKQLADLLHTSNQIVRLWVRERIIPAHRKERGSKLYFLRHEIFKWLMANRYVPGED